jgi:hypothetical protein
MKKGAWKFCNIQHPTSNGVEQVKTGIGSKPEIGTEAVRGVGVHAEEHLR